MTHADGFVMPDRGDGLHWLRCRTCSREWAEDDDGSFVRGDVVCEPDEITRLRAEVEALRQVRDAAEEVRQDGALCDRARNCDSCDALRAALDAAKAAACRCDGDADEHDAGCVLAAKRGE